MTDIVKMIAMKKGLRKSDKYDAYGIVFYNPKYRSYEECFDAWDVPVINARELFFLRLDYNDNWSQLGSQEMCVLSFPDRVAAMDKFREVVSDGMRLSSNGDSSRTFALLGRNADYGYHDLLAESDNDGNIREY